ncbi:hypothetical protein [Bradyrhizobium sp. 1]|uniref:hypothetical protein n=1 Tax=Bradyrhizobium sp. 1 TaxID=241591 RepID=UPI001FF9B570|nr:hypothetical protein [Bradyrhizobium sp. 1]MCK1396133.1 hypothetical protein [Bradyrhizobium sp. 1]
MNGPSKRQDPPRPEAGADRPLSAVHNKRSEIDLPPQDWQSDRQKRREPVFGSGFAPLLAQLTISATALGLVLLVLLFAVVVKKRAHSLIYGEPQGLQRLEPGKSQVINGYTIKRID